MLKSVKTFVFVTLTILCSACASNESRFTPEKFAEGKKGVVFMSIIEDGVSLHFKIKNAESNDVYSISSNRGLLSDGGPLYTTKNMLFLNPGVYYIDYIELLPISSYNPFSGTSSVSYRSLPSPGLEEDGTVKYGAFKIRQNEVHYIGNIDLYKSSVPILDYELLKKQLDKNPKYQILLDKVRPGNFYNGGSIIYRNQEGSSEIINQDTVQKLKSKIIEERINKNN
jgi:hypothetical protein